MILQDHPILAQLKRQLHSQMPRVKGVVQSAEKGFGFLEVSGQKSYFIPSFFMKRVMHGDKILAILRVEREREIAEPEELIEPFLTRFVGQLHTKNNYLVIVPDHAFIKNIIFIRSQHKNGRVFQPGDWVIAKMFSHPLKGDHQFYAEIIALVTTVDHYSAPCLLTLARHNLERIAPNTPKDGIPFQEHGVARDDLTALDFITIDSASTKDIDDAIYVTPASNGAWVMTVAIADPTAWVLAGSTLDIIAYERAFTNYLPGLNVPMLPRLLSDNLCALCAHERRPALVCSVTVLQDGSIVNDARFFTAWIKSKAKLDYANVSNWLESIGEWQPENNAIATQIRLLYDIYQTRSTWRQCHALVSRDQPHYRFLLDDKGNVNDIIVESRRIANRMIEEVMIAANICAARVLRDVLGYGLYIVHNGFDPLLVNQVVDILRDYQIHVNANDLLTLEGFCALRRCLDDLPTTYLDSRIRRFQTFSEISTVPGPHFGLGLDVYATWTSPIRKYGDMINHRLLKSLIGAGNAEQPSKEVTFRLTERRRRYRMAARDVSDWLYALFLQPKAGSNSHFTARIIDISRGGIRVCLLDNGAIAFIPALFIHNVRNEIVFNQSTGIVQVKGREYYRCGDILDVVIIEVRMENYSVIVRPI